MGCHVLLQRIFLTKELNPHLLHCRWILHHCDFPGGSDGKQFACNAGDLGSLSGWEDPLEKEMATHSSIFAWEIPWTEEPVGLYSPWGPKKVGYNLATKQYFDQLKSIE